jgi:2-polyprenyl-3-methyl-5-hydroxy-6-metoxy-1,4-benzoquinol methylase
MAFESAAAINCAICGSPRMVFAFAESDRGESFEQRRCSDCGVSQTVGAVPSVSPDYVRLTAEDLSDDHRFLQTKHKLSAFRQWQSLMQANGKPRGQLLDIGCGVGGFLDFAEAAGYDVQGFDASQVQADSARERHPKVRNAISFDAYGAALGAPVPPIDIVTMWDVFEHIREPRPLLADIREHLAPDGLLYLSIPGGGMNGTKVAIRKLLGKTPGLIPWEHVFYHVPKSLNRVLTDNGFDVVALGGTTPYERAPSPGESIRQGIQKLIAPTSLALQLYAIARPRR